MSELSIGETHPLRLQEELPGDEIEIIFLDLRFKEDDVPDLLQKPGVDTGEFRHLFHVNSSFESLCDEEDSFGDGESEPVTQFLLSLETLRSGDASLWS
ncbi:MAG: hypothetical protein DDT25_01363 [Chloroflexi bacterium]|nr:hypothetical protein [Chloroflexota bacterium]